MERFLSQPVPILFAVCQGVQQLANGAINLLGIFDRLVVYRLPDGTLPEVVNLQVVTLWTGGQGNFEQVFRLLNQDGQQILEMRTNFTLRETAHRHLIVNLIAFPAQEGVFTLITGREEVELLRQDFTLVIEPLPDAGV